MVDFEFTTAHKIVCEVGSAKRLQRYCKALSINKPMVVTDPGLVDVGIIERVLEPLKMAGIKPFVYTEVQADPPEDIVLSAVEKAREHNVDGVLGIGGGSSLDVAKLIAVLYDSQQSLPEIYGVDMVRDARLPLVLVPTTAGTGSEVTPVSIITTGETTKAGVVASQLIPDIAILDAELTIALPAHVTAATGIDAMVHAIEAYTSQHKKNPYSDMLAREALALMSANLLEAVNNGGNLVARSNMLLGAMMAGQAFANSPVAAVHALAYPLGGNYHIPHGLSNSLVLPHVLQFNAPAAAELYAQLLPCVQPSISGQTTSNACDLFINYLDELITAVKLPKTLNEMNIPESDLAMLADQAMLQQRLLVNNPREVSREDALAIYQSAY